MSKQNNFIFEEGETIEGPMNLNEIYYNCSECSSPIEILSINKKANIIEFKCITNNHRKQLSIKEYINKMKKFNNKNINNDICTDNNHNSKYKFFCLDCNKHLCKKCLKTRNHISHNKKILIEMQPSQNELNIIDNIIKTYEDKLSILEREKFDKIQEMKNKLKESESKLNEKIELKIKENQTKMEKELKMKNDEFSLCKQNIKNKYENEINIIENNHKKNVSEITNKYKNINDNYKTVYENEISNLNDKYKKKIKRYNYDEIIENIHFFKRLNEIFYNTYKVYNNNYFNSININNTLINVFDNKIYINDDLKGEYENLIKIKNETINIKKDQNKSKIKYIKNSKLDNIIYFDILEKIFSCLTEKKKLELIHYNKKIQNELDINLNNYKTFTGKYLKYETIVKEFNSDNILIYEGEFLNGKRNGKGKEYYENGILKYEGEYLNGKRKGKGKEYYESGKLKFEGEYSYEKLEFEGENSFERKYNGKQFDEIKLVEKKNIDVLNELNRELEVEKKNRVQLEKLTKELEEEKKIKIKEIEKLNFELEQIKIHNDVLIKKLKQGREQESGNIDEIIRLKKENEEKMKTFEFDELKNELEKEKKNKEEITKLKKELEESKKYQEENSKMKKELDECKEELEMKCYEHEAMKTQITQLNKDLAKVRKEWKNSKYSDKFFQVDILKDGLVKTKKPMTILFRLNKENQKMEVVINRLRHGIFRVATLDILNVKLCINEKRKDLFEICFNVS